MLICQTDFIIISMRSSCISSKVYTLKSWHHHTFQILVLHRIGFWAVRWNRIKANPDARVDAKRSVTRARNHSRARNKHMTRAHMRECTYGQVMIMLRAPAISRCLRFPPFAWLRGCPSRNTLFRRYVMRRLIHPSVYPSVIDRKLNSLMIHVWCHSILQVYIIRVDARRCFFRRAAIARESFSPIDISLVIFPPRLNLHLPAVAFHYKHQE